jgi:hypothetical protein
MSRTPTLFLSHADADKTVVDLFVKFLKQGIGIPSDRIYCTALDQQGNSSGEQFIQAAFNRLTAPDVVVLALVSRNFNESPFCCNEVGAAWAMNRNLLLYSLPPIEHKVLRGVLVDRHAPSLGKRSCLEELRNRLTEALGVKATNASDWNEGVRQFLSALGPAVYEVERKREKIERDLFVSTPMSSVSDEDYIRIRDMAVNIINLLKPDPGSAGASYFNSYYAASTYGSRSDFDLKTAAVEQDLDALCASQNYMLILDRDVKTSTYFEAGIALAYARMQADRDKAYGIADDSVFRRRSTYFVREGVKLPFMMEEVDRKYSSVKIWSYENEAQLLSLVQKYLAKLRATRWESWKIDKG